MMYQEFQTLTNLSISFEEYTNTIEPKYMTSNLDKQSFCKRYLNSQTTKPLPKELKEIKETIKDFKGNRSFAKREEKKLIERHNERMKDYNSNNWVDQNFIKTLENRLQKDIYNLYEMYGNDTTIQIIYTDGTECNVTGTEIVTGEITPKLPIAIPSNLFIIIFIPQLNQLHIHNPTKYLRSDSEMNKLKFFKPSELFTLQDVKSAYKKLVYQFHP